jgi:hypothetical protein
VFLSEVGTGSREVETWPCSIQVARCKSEKTAMDAAIFAQAAERVLLVFLPGMVAGVYSHSLEKLLEFPVNGAN